MSTPAQHTTTVIGVTCDGAAKHQHGVRTVAQYHDKYWTSWELTANFGGGIGIEAHNRYRRDVPPEDEQYKVVVLDCPDPQCKVRQLVRWETLHAMLDQARENGATGIRIKDLTESTS